MTCQLYVQGKQAKDALVGGCILLQGEASYSGRKTHWWGGAFYSSGKQVTPGERRIGGRVHFTPGGSKLLRSNMHLGCKLLRALYFVTERLFDR